MAPYLSLGVSVTWLVVTLLAIPVLYLWRRAKLFDGLGLADTRLYLAMLLKRGYDGAHLFIWHIGSGENVQFRKYILGPTDIGLELLMPRAAAADRTRFEAVQEFLTRHDVRFTVEQSAIAEFPEYIAVDVRGNTDLGLVLMDAIFHEIMDVPRARQFRVRSAGLRRADELIDDAGARPSYAPPATPPQYEHPIRRLTADARRQPGRYRVRVTCLAIAGHVYVLGLLCALAATLAVVITRLSALTSTAATAAVAGAVATVGAMLVRTLCIRLPAPVGVHLRRENAPALFALVDEVAAALPAPAPRDII